MTAASGGGRYGATGAAWGEDSSEYKDLLTRGGGEKASEMAGHTCAGPIDCG